MGLGAALQQIGTMYLQRNWQQKDQAKAAEQQRLAREQEMKEWEAKQRFLARLGAPPERVRQVYDEQLKNAIAVREQWDPDAQSWREQGRDALPPRNEVIKYRQGDQEVTAIGDPNNPAGLKELGRGSAFSPSQRGGGGGGALAQLSGKRQPQEAQPTAAPQSKFDAARSQEEAKALGQDAKNVLERGEAARQQLAILERLSELQEKVGTGPIQQYFENSLTNPEAQEYDAQAAQLLGPTLKAMFGANPTEGERKAAFGALPSRDKDETVNRNLIMQAKERASKALREAGALKRPPNDSAAAPASNAAGQSRNNPVQISSEAEADNLPPGTWVILNGRLGQT